ncbi:MAG: hypothetical protein AAB573_01090 [Patescibacteria group bacterium]
MWETASATPGGFVDYQGGAPKIDFLQFLVEEKRLLLHGSNWDVAVLEPRLANCKSKKFGNLNAVYAVEDPMLPIFYAVKDKNKFNGVAVSGTTQDGDKPKKYVFKVEQQMLNTQPWSAGVVYILSREGFEQGTDDDDFPIDEYISRIPVTPLAKLAVSPHDFPYLGSIKSLQ